MAANDRAVSLLHAGHTVYDKGGFLFARAKSDDEALQALLARALLAEPARGAAIDPDLVAAVLGLTPTESRVAVMLAEGHSVREIAAAMQRKESTIRYHVKRIFAKQGLNRQADLVRLVLSLAGAAGLPR